MNGPKWLLFENLRNKMNDILKVDENEIRLKVYQLK